MASSAQSQTFPLQPIRSEPRLCWICQQDETEDESLNTVWKSPCPCSLTAHNECLLEWITAQETPRAGIQLYNKPIQCPQCQSLIQIQRPHDYLVQAYNAVYRVGGSLAVPAALSGVLGCVYSGFLVYGFNTMEVVFGARETRRLLGGAIQNNSLGAQWFSLVQKTLRWSLTAFDPFFPSVQTNSNWKIFVGLPLIGPALILSRTRLADQAFPLLLPLYFVDPSHRQGDFFYPPLSPGLAFSTLPYITTAYNMLYRQFVTPHEKRWDTAVQRPPRQGETAADVAAQAEEEPAALLEIQFVEEAEPIEEDVAFDLGVVGQNIGVAAEQPDVVVEQPPALNDNPLQAAGGQQPAQGRIPNENDNGGWQIRQDIPLRDVLASTMGALFFPTVASYAGELLYYTLPNRMVSKNMGLRSTGWTPGLLREKWGRTIIGGCLFVLLKDAVTLYVKWKRARDFGKRTILDYTGKRTRSP